MLTIFTTFSAVNYMFKVNNRDIRTRCEIRSKLTIKTSERRRWRRSVLFIVNFEHILHSSILPIYFSVSIVNLEQVNTSWVYLVENCTDCFQ